MIGLVYSDESEANSMMKVVSRKKSAVGEWFTPVFTIGSGMAFAV